MMRKSKYPYKVYNGKVLRAFLLRARFYALALPWLLGLICGACTLGRLTASQVSALSGTVQRLIAAHEGGWLQIFRNTLMLHSGALVLTIFLGFSLIGCPFLLLVPFFQGVGLGLVSGYFYTTYKLAGVGYCLAVLYPAALAAAAALLFSCRDSWLYSRNAYEKAIRGRGEMAKDETKVFLVRQGMYLLLCALSALIEAVFSALFSGLFRF